MYEQLPKTRSRKKFMIAVFIEAEAANHSRFARLASPGAGLNSTRRIVELSEEPMDNYSLRKRCNGLRGQRTTAHRGEVSSVRSGGC